MNCDNLNTVISLAIANCTYRLRLRKNVASIWYDTYKNNCSEVSWWMLLSRDVQRRAQLIRSVTQNNDDWTTTTSNCVTTLPREIWNM